MPLSFESRILAKKIFERNDELTVSEFFQKMGGFGFSKENAAALLEKWKLNGVVSLFGGFKFGRSQLVKFNGG